MNTAAQPLPVPHAPSSARSALAATTEPAWVRWALVGTAMKSQGISWVP